MSKKVPKTLLVVKNRAMGDSIIGLSTLQYLRQIHPDTLLIYGVPSWVAPLYNNVETAADIIVPIKLKSLHDFYKLWKLLRSYKVDQVLELFQSGRTQKFFTLWRMLGGPKYNFHNHHKASGDVFDQGVIKANIQRDIDGAWSFLDKSQSNPPSHLNYPPFMKVKEYSSPLKKQIILGVVATRETKMWPLEYYIDFVKKFLKEFTDYSILIPLGPGDQKIKDTLHSLESKRCFFVEESLESLPKILAHSSLYLGNDTGLKHICVSLGIPTFTLFGPEPPTEWHPYDTKKHSFYYRENLECRTRKAHYCGLSVCDSMICLNEFKADDLIKVCREKLSY